MKNRVRQRLSLSGQVQGVGFRPFVFRLAERYGLTGSVLNTTQGVVIEVQGAPAAVASFGLALRKELPPLARLETWRAEDLPALRGERGFRILGSAGAQEARARAGAETGPAAPGLLTSPDMAACPACLRETEDPADRRFGYAFTNCTDCGPRYSIIRALPYDRPATSMACFPMCPACAAEYANPAARRFHAQPNACPECGPRLWFTTAQRPGPDSLPANCPGGNEALALAAERLRRGDLVAVKGLGGFQLACDATSPAAVARLRERKRRPHKALAVMVDSLEQAAALLGLDGPGQLDRNAAAWLTAPERPIVLCPAKADTAAEPGLKIAPNVAPDTSRIGLMLPCTPLHRLLLRAVGRPLVMTSGNRSDEPIALGNREALERLGGPPETRLADGFLLHDRDILTRLDDSVLLPLPEAAETDASAHASARCDSPATTSAENAAPGQIFLRRARGFVPSPLSLPQASAACVLALGADLKNTACLTRGRLAFVSQHIGDLQNLENAAFQAESAAHLARLLRVKPDYLVADSHPAFAVNLRDGAGAAGAALPAAWAGLPRLSLQHHFAHAEAVLAENAAHPALRADGGGLVLALDGAGYALDEAGRPELRGGELLLLDCAAAAGAEHRRLGSLTPLDLPGGEAAVREPWRIAQALLCRLKLEAGASLPWLPAQARTAALIPQMLEKGINSPLSSGCGRVFDAASALLGLCLETSYEGQAALRLETAQALGGRAAAPPAESLPLDCPLLENDHGNPPLLLDTRTLLRGLFLARRNGASVTGLARAFHLALAEGLAEMALAGARLSGCRCVGLSGGVMQNLTLFSLLWDKLRQRGLQPLAHRQLPPNDACISYGQAVWAARRGPREPLLK